VKGREVDRVLVTAPDRLARNYVHQMVLLEEWAQAGCAAAFLDRPMSDDPHDHLLLQIRGAVAEYERTLIAERMRRGRLAKLRAGVLLPWTYAPYGYRMSPDRPRDPHGVTLDPAEAAVVAELFALYREPGMSLMRLAMHLDARGVPTPSGTPRWSSATIRGILRNPIYTGQIHAQRTQYRAPTHRRSATHPIGRPHGTPVPQPADACHPSVQPRTPQRWWWYQALQARLKATDAALEERRQAAQQVARLRGRGFFSSGVAWWTMSHIPVETAQNSASAMTRMSRAMRSGRSMWLSSRPKPLVLKSANIASIPHRRP
jgi:site-specific DNA recombinase